MIKTSQAVQLFILLLFPNWLISFVFQCACNYISSYLHTVLRSFYGMFTLPDTETNKETDKKNDCTELCGGAAQRQIPTQIAVEFSADLGRVV